MRIKIDLESDELADGLLIYIDEGQKMKIYKSWLDMDEGIELEVSLKAEFLCPSCGGWTEAENWTEKYICQSCAWRDSEN